MLKIKKRERQGEPRNPFSCICVIQWEISGHFPCERTLGNFEHDFVSSHFPHHLQESVFCLRKESVGIRKYLSFCLRFPLVSSSFSSSSSTMTLMVQRTLITVRTLLYPVLPLTASRISFSCRLIVFPFSSIFLFPVSVPSLYPLHHLQSEDTRRDIKRRDNRNGRRRDILLSDSSSLLLYLANKKNKNWGQISSWVTLRILSMDIILAFMTN